MRAQQIERSPAVRQQLDEPVEDRRETMAEKASVAKEKVRQGMDRLRDIERKASDQAVEAAEQTKTTIRDHPWASMGIMAAAGMVVGSLMGRISR